MPLREVLVKIDVPQFSFLQHIAWGEGKGGGGGGVGRAGLLKVHVYSHSSRICIALCRVSFFLCALVTLLLSFLYTPLS